MVSKHEETQMDSVAVTICLHSPLLMFFPPPQTKTWKDQKFNWPSCWQNSEKMSITAYYLCPMLPLDSRTISHFEALGACPQCLHSVQHPLEASPAPPCMLTGGPGPTPCGVEHPPQRAPCEWFLMDSVPTARRFLQFQNRQVGT